MWGNVCKKCGLRLSCSNTHIYTIYIIYICPIWISFLPRSLLTNKGVARHDFYHNILTNPIQVNLSTSKNTYRLVIPNFFFKNFFIDVLPAWMSMYMDVSNVWCPWRPGGRVRCPGTGVTNSCQLPWRFWDLNPCPLKEKPVILTAEPALRSPDLIS